MADSLQILADQEALSLIEKNKRKDQSIHRPRVHEKIQQYFKNMLDGEISPILRIKINRSLCNFHCMHCCEEPYMTRDIKKQTGVKLDPRPQMDLDDYKELSKQADEAGIFRFVLTGGEALLDKNLDKLIEAINVSGTTNLVISKTDILQKGEINTYKFIYSQRLIEYESLEKMTETINSFLTLLCPHLTDIIYSNSPESL